MSVTIALANNKGGVGKTASAVNLAREFAHRGRHVLLIDMDPQANATDAMVDNPDEWSFLTCIANDGFPREIIIPGEHFDVLPSHWGFIAEEVRRQWAPTIPEKIAEDMLLRYFLERLPEDSLPYDVIVLDTPPSLDLHTRMALCASDLVIVPVKADAFASAGYYNLDRLIIELNATYGLSIRFLGTIVTMFKARTKISRAIQLDLQETLGDLLLNPFVSDTVIVGESLLQRTTLRDYAPDSPAAATYQTLADKILDLAGR